MYIERAKEIPSEIKKKLFNEIPIIENDRLILKRLESGDTSSLYEFIENDDIYRYLPTFLFEKQYSDMNEMIEKLYTECFDAKDSIILGIYLKEKMSFCGLAEFYGYKDMIHKTCIGYRLLQKQWGRGIASEAVSLMIDYLYGETDIEIITASTMIENKASARVLEKNGFIRTSRSVPEDWGFETPTIADKWFR